ncbi:MAG: hypothetical protein JWP56_3145 [Aeromicrobium sp.]|nr:hypothetical protein [Aeromicrobium sp.]
MNDGTAERLVDYAGRQHERDQDTLAALTGTTEDLQRTRAAQVLGTADTAYALGVAARLRRQARQAGTLTRDEAETLVAAEVVRGRRTDIGREVEALLQG